MDPLRYSSKRASRRRLLARVGTVAAAALLAATGIPALHAAPAAASDCGATLVNWWPDIGHRVAWGYEDVNSDLGAPRNMRIYYPSEHTPAYRAPLLQLCIQFPLVLFLPGEAPPGLAPADYYKGWDAFGEILARSGYIVAVPEDSADVPDGNYGPAVQAALDDITYLRTAWSGSEYVSQNSKFTIVGGHSNGALLAARVAAANPHFAAYFSLGGRFHLLPDPEQAASAGGMPSFFMWAKSESRGASLEDLDIDDLWAKLPQMRYAVTYAGEHYDYLPNGQTGTWPAGKYQAFVGLLASDYLAMFVAKFVLGYTHVYDGLAVQSVPLTERQKEYAAQRYPEAGEFLYTIIGGKGRMEWWFSDDDHGSRMIH